MGILRIGRQDFHIATPHVAPDDVGRASVGRIDGTLGQMCETIGRQMRNP